jgi:murein DD-endopeptidase MepM/ murein hydrolase activator NlpD
MLVDSLNQNNDKDSNSNPFGSMFAMQQNPMMMQMMMGGGMNPMSQMQMNPMMMMGGMDPMMMQMMQAKQSSPLGHVHDQAFVPSGDFVMPVAGRISSEYGHRHHPIQGHSHFHSGVDIAADRGTPIRMPWDGKVVHVGYVSGFGDNTVIVAHENNKQADGKIVYSIFGHNDKALVRVGDQLHAGEIVGTVGSEGNSTGPHLHWETRVAEPGVEGREIFAQNVSKTVDPMSLVQQTA